MNKLEFGCRTVAFFIALSIISGWQNILFPIEQAIDQHTTTTAAIFLIAIALLFLILNLIAALGLYLLQKWGCIVTYIAIVFSTVFFSNTYIPLINKLFPLAIRPISLIIINLLLIGYVAYLQISLQRQRSINPRIEKTD
jgi:uncharacterized membrane protein (DUF2068 family)